MAEFTKIMKTKKRMCDSFGGDCGNCPLEYMNTGMNVSCNILLLAHPDKAEEIILQWDKKHPSKTRLKDFLEKYPKAKLNESGVPISCASYLGYVKTCPAKLCKDCWNTALED